METIHIIKDNKLYEVEVESCGIRPYGDCMEIKDSAGDVVVLNITKPEPNKSCFSCLYGRVDDNNCHLCGFHPGMKIFNEHAAAENCEHFYRILDFGKHKEQ